MVGYTTSNHFFAACDAFVLYLVVQRSKPTRVIKVRCGHSTQVKRQAIRDGELSIELIAIDPERSVVIAGVFNRFERGMVDEVHDAVFRVSTRATFFLSTRAIRLWLAALSLISSAKSFQS